jgi:hypothetical protein
MIYSKAIWLTKEQIDPEESNFALSADLHHKWNYVELCVIMWNKTLCALSPLELWSFGRGNSRSMSVEKADSLRAERITAARKQAASTKRRQNN